VVLLLTKRDWWSRQATSVASGLFGANLTAHEGAPGDPLPDIDPNRSDIVLSFLSPWIVPASVLGRSRISLNFHPGSRNYPGIGCYNFALYEGATKYGCVCHHMVSRVDRGNILHERLFDVSPDDTVESLKLRTMIVMLALFHEVVGDLAARRPLPSPGTGWGREPFKRRELEALREVDLTMSREEIERRVRATTYPGYPGAVVRLHGVEFHASAAKRDPIA
jgi:methionyl-tRNA formyltransferase